MSDDSSDCSDMNTRPSGSKGRQDQKRKRRIVMRIEFDDSDDTSSASDPTSEEEEEDDDVKGSKNDGGNDLNIAGPSCSVRLRNRQNMKNHKKYNETNNDDDDDDSDEFHAATRRLRRSGRRANVLDVGFSDGSSSGSEITRKRSRGKKYIVSEDEREPKSPSNTTATKNTAKQHQQDEPGFTSDSSSNELLEKCPICLLTFRRQEIGSPSTCEHIFCANCIEAWSKNVQTCPIDRIEFQRIIVRESFENRKIVREINVDPNAQKELVLDDEDIVDIEDVTNCEVCSRSDREDVMLLCDHCDQGYHMDCLSPPLSEIPEGSWFCDNCVDSEDEDEAGDDEEDLNMLYEDIRDMGIPESRLRVREVPQQPRILRTRQNERIRAAILRRTRASVARLETTTTTTTTTAQRGRPRTSTTTTTTTARRSTHNRNSSVGGSVRKPRKRRRRRRARQRTYVVEYDLNNFDEKFAIKTTKKVIRRRRRKARTSSKRGRRSTSSRGERMTASKRLAEQMGVKPDPKYTSHLSRPNAGLSLFGGANDLEYFSDSDGGNIESEIHIDTGHGTAVQTSVRISNYGSQRSRKGLLLGRLQPNREIAEPVVEENNTNPDILSSIMDMQDRWHSATRNMESVRINSDGTLNLPNSNERANSDTTPTKPAPTGGDNNKNPTEERAQNGPSSSDINQAPMYSRGGGNPNFNRGGGGYTGRSNTSQSSYRGGGGGGNQYRNSTGGSASGGGGNFGGGVGTNFSMVGRGNFNFSNNPNYNGPPQQQQQNQQNNVSPFQQRNFNQRNQQNNTNNQRNIGNMQQRHSLPPFTNNIICSDINQQQQPISNNRFGHMPQQTCLPPPPLLINQQLPPIQQNLQQPPPMNENNSLFGGLPPPMTIPPPHLNVAPPPTVSQIPVLMSVPPPPAPPSVVIPPQANNSLFQLNSDYGNDDDDDSNCPNFAIYSHESQQVAKSTESYPDNATTTANAAKEDDENEDLVQLDDDDEIPMPPEPNPTENIESAELYEPENPTEEIYDEDDVENSSVKDKNVTKDDGDDFGDDNDDDEKNEKSKKDRDEKLTNSGKYDPENDAVSSNADTTPDIKDTSDDKQQSNTVRSPSPATSEIRLPESESAAANRKGVLELYDDSDWEELDIDRPKENDKKNKNTTKTGRDNEENKSETEQDRSYTPCLDENNDPEEPETEAATPGKEENSPTVLSANKNAKSATKSNKKDDRTSADENIQDMDTELISEEEDDDVRNNRDRKKNQKGNNDKRGSDKRGDDNDKVETFKKIGNKQKIRNYRGDQKQPGPNNRRTNKRRKSRSPVSRSRSRTRSRSRSRSRSANSFRSRGGRSRSRSPRYRGRSRSRSRSNNKENQGRWAGNQRDGGRFYRNNQFNQQNFRLKRRELPRYDVRNVVGHHSSPSKLVSKDRYGRDTSRNKRNSRSLSRGRRGPPQGRSPFSRSRSRSRNRRLSISLSPSPSYSRRRSLSPGNPPRHFSPARRRSISDSRRTPPFRQQRSSRSPLRVIRSRSVSPAAQRRMNGRKVTRHLRGSSQPRILNRGQRSRSLSLSPRYTPRISRSRSKTPRPKGGKKKKAKISRKKKSKRRMANMSPSPNRRISRQPDPFDIEKPPKKKRRRSSREKSPLLEDHGWSPSPSPQPTQAITNNFDYPPDKNVSWTPPMQSPLLGLFRSGNVRSVSPTSRKDKTKRTKKKKKIAKRRDGRKEKKRKRRTETPEPAPSKEVFASGNNILVSVSFNKETTLNQQHSQQTIVTLPSNRDDLMSSNRRVSIDRATNISNAAKRRKDKRKKIDTKPVAIIDLERSPFQVEQEQTDIIVLTDSEEANEHDQQREHRRDRHRSESSCPRDTDAETTTHRNQRSGGGASAGQRGDKTTPERMDTIHEESYDLTQTGPKTPPEPPLVKFNLQTKKQSKVRNPLHEDEDDMASDGELDERQQQQQQENHRSDMDTMHVQSSQKIGPNTPPESGPCSPDAYDPFEPTKSPSISPRSPTPPPSQLDVSQNSICGESNGDLVATQKHIDNEQQRREQIPGLGGNIAQGASLNPVDLVMALINSKSASNNNQDLTNKSNDSQHLNSNDDLFRDKGNDEGNSITVLSNLLITSGNMQHIPSISSPTPPSAMSKKLPAKIGGSVGGSSSSGVNVRNGGTAAGTSNNADDSFNMNDIESPYSPGSAEYDDLFEPPPEASGGTKRRSKRGKPTEVFDNLFGSSSPAGNLRLPSYTPSKKYKGVGGAVGASRKSKVKVGKSNNDDVIKVYDDVPNSAVELHVKDKFLRKLNRQERVVEEVKLILKPRFNKKQINKDDYKEIMRRAVPKICHSRSGEIDPLKIKRLIEAYVKKFRSKHKKLNIVNTGQVSSAVKCAAYLKKL